MQLGGFLCYTLLTIAVTAPCVTGEERQKRALEHRPRKVIKRNTAVLIDNFSVEPSYSQNAKVIFRKASRHRPRYSLSKLKYGPPKSSYGPPSRKPSKNFRKQLSSKYGPQKHRSPKPRYGPPKKHKKPMSSPPKVSHATLPQHYTPEPTGFAEPPSEFKQQKHKQRYSEPPVDSYGAPLKTTYEPNPTAPSYDANNYFEQNEFSSGGQEYSTWQGYQQDSSQDTTYANSKKRPLFIKPDEVFNIQVSPEEDGFRLNSPIDFNYHSYKEPQYLNNKLNKPQFFADSNKKLSNYWKAPKLRPDNYTPEIDDEILVGGQYAEPPARYVTKFQPSAPMYSGDGDFIPHPGYVDSEIATSGTISPYVNYKNSNMAFSPQNLNDAFSIVDK